MKQAEEFKLFVPEATTAYFIVIKHCI